MQNKKKKKGKTPSWRSKTGIKALPSMRSTRSKLLASLITQKKSKDTSNLKGKRCQRWLSRIGEQWCVGGWRRVLEPSVGAVGLPKMGQE